MALLFMDGFSHYSTSQIGLKWKGGVSGTPTITGSAGRVTGDAMVTNTNEYVIWVSESPKQEILFGFAHKNVTESSDGSVASIRSSTSTGTPYLDIQWDVSDDRYIFLIGGQIEGYSSSVTQGEWNYLEGKVLVDNLVGTYEFRLNEVTQISGTNADTQHLSVFPDIIYMGMVSGSGTNHFDDVYIADTTGSAPQNDFLGDVTVEMVLPDSNGTTTNFTPSAGSNFENVDEANHDGDTTYNSTTTASNKDTLNFAAMTAAAGTVYGVQTNFTARKSDVGARTMSDVIRSGGTDYDGSSISIGNSFKTYSEIHETNPNTSSAWTISEINSAEFGYKIQT
jgi:hypothetical protein